MKTLMNVNETHIIADTGRHPNSLRVDLSATAALVPPHWPPEYVTVGHEQ
jgi:hypothetical protein